MNWLDLGILVFAVIFVMIGIKKGFMTSLLSNFSLGVNVLLSFFLCRPIGFILNKMHLGEAIANSYTTKFFSAEVFSQNLMTIPSGELKGFVSGAINQSGISNFGKWLFEIFLNNNRLYANLHDSGLESRTLGEIMSSTYASFFVTIISFVISMVLLYLIVLLFRFIVKKLRTIGFVKVVDNILGALYGLARCLIFLIIISCIIKLLSFMSWTNQVINYIDGSFFGRLIYNQISDFFNNFLNFKDIVRAIFGS